MRLGVVHGAAVFILSLQVNKIKSGKRDMISRNDTEPRSALGVGNLFRIFTVEEIAALKENFYHTPQWRHKRAEILRRDHYECQRCRKVHHRYGRATTVHHIQHLDAHPELAVTDSNLISLCANCHNEVHPEKCEQIRKEKRWQDEKW